MIDQEILDRVPVEVLRVDAHAIRIRSGLDDGIQLAVGGLLRDKMGVLSLCWLPAELVRVKAGGRPPAFACNYGRLDNAVWIWVGYSCNRFTISGPDSIRCIFPDSWGNEFHWNILLPEGEW
jgi:hypothetical protein